LAIPLKGFLALNLLDWENIQEHCAKSSFTYVGKEALKFPVKRFVICVDTNEEVTRMNYDELQCLEFPFFLLLLNFLELLPMSRLDNCLSFGKINADGELTQLSVNEKVFDYCRVSKLSMIHHECHMDRVIDTKELLRDIPALRWRESLPG
jgi:hypothetical protein